MATVEHNFSGALATWKSKRYLVGWAHVFVDIFVQRCEPVRVAEDSGYSGHRTGREPERERRRS